MKRILTDDQCKRLESVHYHKVLMAEFNDHFLTLLITLMKQVVLF